MWPSLIAKAKEGGLDVIQTLVFWNLHEPQPGQVITPVDKKFDCFHYIKKGQNYV